LRVERRRYGNVKGRMQKIKAGIRKGLMTSPGFVAIVVCEYNININPADE
jgi:hypothetical protein